MLEHVHKPDFGIRKFLLAPRAHVDRFEYVVSSVDELGNEGGVLEFVGTDSFLAASLPTESWCLGDPDSMRWCADVSGDDLPDLALLRQGTWWSCDGAELVLVDPTGTRPPTLVAMEAWPQKLDLIVCFDQAGRVDRTVRWDEGAWVAHRCSPDGPSVWELALEEDVDLEELSDIDDDGISDLAAINDNSVRLISGHDGASIGGVDTYVNGKDWTFPHFEYLGDLDGDGVAEVLVWGLEWVRPRAWPDGTWDLPDGWCGTRARLMDLRGHAKALLELPQKKRLHARAAPELGPGRFVLVHNDDRTTTIEVFEDSGLGVPEKLWSSAFEPEFGLVADDCQFASADGALHLYLKYRHKVVKLRIEASDASAKR